jgi:hypothetical protein
MDDPGLVLAEMPSKQRFVSRSVLARRTHRRYRGVLLGQPKPTAKTCERSRSPLAIWEPRCEDAHTTSLPKQIRRVGGNPRL